MPGSTVRQSYRVHVDRPADHLAQITLEVRELDAPTFDLVLPSWVPGSYVIQPTARGIVELTATPGGGTEPLAVTLVDKARWRVATAGARSVEVRYTVYGHLVADDALDITPEHRFLSPPMCFPYVDGRKDEPCEVVLPLPEGWEAVTELREVGRYPSRFRAETYDQLIDSPIDCGTMAVYPFVAGGVPHRFVVCGEGGNLEPHRLQQDLAKIAETTIRLFGESPVDRYTFFYHLSDVYDGGLEHATSNVCMLRRDAFRPESEYQRVLRVSSHEYFHLYNVKRLRPTVLGPFDYTRENYTRLLWWMEGTTDYYGFLILRRAGLLAPGRYLSGIAEHLDLHFRTPGRGLQSLETASLRSWLDYYQRYENTPNQSISYYIKGHLVSMCLDLDIRHRTDGAKSLDTVLRHLWAEYGRRGVGLGEDDLLPAARTATGLDLDDFFAQHVRGTRELDFDRYLGFAGLTARPKERPPEPDVEGEPGYLGATLKNVDNRPVLTSLYRGAPGQLGGLSPGDEVVALNRSKVTYDGFDRALKGFGPGATVEFGVFRRGYLRTVTVTLGTSPAKFEIVPRASATDAERRVHEEWLGARWEPPKGKS